MTKKIVYALICISFYSLATNQYRLNFAGFSVPLLLIPLFFLGLPRFQGLKINGRILLVAELLLVYILVMTFSSLISEPAVSVPTVAKTLLCFAVLILSYSLAKDRSDSEIFGLLFGIVIASGGWALLHSLYYRLVLGAPYLSVSLDGIVSEAGKNQIANYLGGLTVLSFFLMFQEISSRFVRVGVRLSFLFHTVALLYTFSRSALLVAIFIIGSYSVVTFRADLIKFITWRKVLMVVPVVFAALYVGVSADVSTEFTDNLVSIMSMQDTGDSTSIAVRQELIRNALDIFTHNPLLGKGPGTFVDATGIATHNSYVQLLAETGLLGLLSFLFFLAAPIVISDKSRVVMVLKPTLAYFALSLLFQNALDSIFLYFFVGVLCAKSMKAPAISYVPV